MAHLLGESESRAASAVAHTPYVITSVSGAGASLTSSVIIDLDKNWGDIKQVSHRAGGAGCSR